MCNNYKKYLEKIKFDKQLKRLERKLKNKKAVVHGTGLFFDSVADNYDLSKLNIIAITDKKFDVCSGTETYKGFRICSPCDVVKLKPDYVLVGTWNTIDLIDNLAYDILDKKIKIMPLVKKGLKEWLTEFIS